MKRALLVIALFVLCAAAPSPAPKPGGIDSVIRKAAAAAAITAAEQDAPDTRYGTPSPDVRAAYQARAKARFDEDAYRSEHVRWVYDAQYWASWLILLLVFAIVVAGLLFSVAQARIALHAVKSNARHAVDIGATLKLSTSGVEVTSSVLGTITLVISALFLYLYLQTVYPITIEQTSVSPNRSAQPAPQPAARGDLHADASPRARSS